jgi:hypothetical protein
VLLSENVRIDATQKSLLESSFVVVTINEFNSYGHEENVRFKFVREVRVVNETDRVFFGGDDVFFALAVHRIESV